LLNNSKPLPQPTLADTLQLLAIYRPTALKVIQIYAAQAVVPVLEKLAEQAQAQGF
jgi:hypothetical protein